MEAYIYHIKSWIKYQFSSYQALPILLCYMLYSRYCHPGQALRDEITKNAANLPQEPDHSEDKLEDDELEILFANLSCVP